MVEKNLKIRKFLSIHWLPVIAHDRV